jgi:hypothetical protein
MADVQDIYRGIISPNGGLYQPGPEVVFPQSQPADVVRVTPEGLNVRSVQTVAVDPFTGALIQSTPKGNTAVRAALGREQSDAFRESKGSGPVVASAPGQPSGSIVVGKDNSRLGNNEYKFAFGPEPQPNEAVAAIDGITVPLPRKRPNIEANPGTNIPIRTPDGGMFGVQMSPGMARNLAGRAGVTGLPGIGAVPRVVIAAPPPANPRVAQALAAQQAAPFYSNGVANPAYRDYGPQSSPDGGVLPANSFGGNGGGGFTDSLGGRYYDRHL